VHTCAKPLVHLSNLYNIQYLSHCQIPLRQLKLWLSHYDLKSLSTVVLTLTFDLDLSKVKGEIGTDASRLGRINCCKRCTDEHSNI